MSDSDRRSEQALAYRGWYGTPAWRSLRDAHRAAHPLCAMCLDHGRVNDGTFKADGSRQTNTTKRRIVVDHRTPHRGVERLFFDATNLQSLCADHHDRIKQTIEARGYDTSVGDDGWPVDQQHRAYKNP